jgi:5-methylcytosine-specific restriction endonuclease McrA
MQRGVEMELKGLEFVAVLADHFEEEVDALAVHLLGAERDKKWLFWGVVRETISARDWGCCWSCGQEVGYKALQVDHVIPWSRGGRTDEENGVVSWRPCNRQKSAKVW